VSGYLLQTDIILAQKFRDTVNNFQRFLKVLKLPNVILQGTDKQTCIYLTITQNCKLPSAISIVGIITWIARRSNICRRGCYNRSPTGTGRFCKKNEIVNSLDISAKAVNISYTIFRAVGKRRFACDYWLFSLLLSPQYTPEPENQSPSLTLHLKPNQTQSESCADTENYHPSFNTASDSKCFEESQVHFLINLMKFSKCLVALQWKWNAGWTLDIWGVLFWSVKTGHLPINTDDDVQ